MAIGSIPKLGTELFEFIKTKCENSGREGLLRAVFGG